MNGTDSHSYVGQQQAVDDFITTIDSNGANLLGLDIGTVLDPNGPTGRETVRITSKQSFTHGLIISDLNNMPGGACGTSAGR